MQFKVFAIDKRKTKEASKHIENLCKTKFGVPVVTPENNYSLTFHFAYEVT